MCPHFSQSQHPLLQLNNNFPSQLIKLKSRWTPNPNLPLVKRGCRPRYLHLLRVIPSVLNVVGSATLVPSATKKSASLGGTSKRTSVRDVAFMDTRGGIVPSNVTGAKTVGGMDTSPTNAKRLHLSTERISLSSGAFVGHVVYLATLLVDLFP